MPSDTATGTTAMLQPAPAVTPLLVDTAGAAKLLAVSPRTIWTLTNRGELPAVRINRAVRYALADLERFVAAQREKK